MTSPWPVALLLLQAAPVERVWIRSPDWGSTVQSIAPDVHQVLVDEAYVRVRSAGISFQSFGPLQVAPVDESKGVLKFEFQIPRRPRPAERTEIPWGAMGVFVNGVPMHPAAGSLTYADQDLWHVDAVAQADDGTFTARGRPSANAHGRATPELLRSLLGRNQAHSPIIGFALDGYPVYGPYGWDAQRRVRRFRPSYQLRSIALRNTLPGGLRLHPGQEGPAVGGEFPLGLFAEDYEFVAGSGDLDRHNGRFGITPEYPQGSYAYFVSTNDAGKLAYPYMIGPSYYGAGPDATVGLRPVGESNGLALLASHAKPVAGMPLRWLFRASSAALEKAHERRLHLLVISRDLTRFDHVHPTPVTADTLELSYTFAKAGSYWLFADYTPAGGVQTIARFQVTVSGGIAPPEPQPRREELKATLSLDGPAQTGQDIGLVFALSERDLEPYLGAWGHIMILSQDGEDFIHAHPKEAEAVSPDPFRHAHSVAGPSPSAITTTTGFRRPGLYKVWLQVQRRGEVLTFPFEVRIAPGAPGRTSGIEVPKGAIPILVGAGGFSPPRVEVPRGKAAKLAFIRRDAQNCGGRIVFPSLGIDRPLASGTTTLIDLPPLGSDQVRFTCGMGMYRGAVIGVW